MFPLAPNMYFEIGAFITSVVLWPRLRATKLRWLLPYLLLIVSVEMTGRYITYNLHKPNFWLYNFSIPAEYLFYSYIFLLHFRRGTHKGIAKWFLLLFLGFIVVNLFFIQGISAFNSNFLKVGSLAMIIFSCLYFVEILTADEVVNTLALPEFWLVVGIFLFNTGEFFSGVLSEIFVEQWQKWRRSYATINSGLIYLLYSCIITSIILASFKSKKQSTARQ